MAQANTGVGSRQDQAPTSGNSLNASEEAAIELSPFTVNADSDVGYLANNSLAGSRLNQSLKDTAASISVFTPEFLSDIGAFDLDDVVAYAVNIEMQLDDDRDAINGNETVNEYQKYRVRGLIASVARNYFVWNIPSEVALIERIEDSRGPNSVLFGIASPGGLINSSTKQANSRRAFQKASLTLASEDSKRVTFDYNQPLIQGKLAFRINLVYNKTNSFRHWAFKEDRRGHISVNYNITNRTRVRAEYERGQIDSNVPRTYNLGDAVSTWDNQGRPTFATQAANTSLGIARHSTGAAAPRVTYISNNNQTISMRGVMLTSSPNGNAVITDRRMTDYSINFGGPGQTRFSHFDTVSAYFEHQFSKTTFLEIAFNHQEHKYEGYDPRSTTNLLQGDPNQLLNNGAANPYAGHLYLESSWFRRLSHDLYDTGRATFSTEFDRKHWGRYRVAAFTEYEKNFRRLTAEENETWLDAATGLPAFHATPENAANFVWRRTYLTEGDWANYYVNGPGKKGVLTSVTDPVTGRTLTSTWGIPRGSSSPAETFVTQKAYMIAGQARYFKNRLILAGGLRRDDYNAYTLGRMRDPETGRWTPARNDADAVALPRRDNSVGRNKTFGVVYHVHPKVSLFYNKADNISLPARGQTVFTPEGEAGNIVPPPPPKGDGMDYGFSLDLLEGRLFTRATYYTTATKGQHTTFGRSAVRDANSRIMNTLLAHGLISEDENVRRRTLPSFGRFDHSSNGVELQATANVTRNWRFQANYARAVAVEENKFMEWKAWDAQTIQFLSTMNTTGLITDGGRTIAEEVAIYQDVMREITETDGLGKLGNRHHKVSAFTRYNFSSGFLRGAYMGGGYIHQSKNFVGLDDLGTKLYGNSYWRADAVVGYKLRGLPNRRSISFQLNVKNVFNQREPLITRYRPDGIRVFREVVQPPATWRLTTNVEF